MDEKRDAQTVAQLVTHLDYFQRYLESSDDVKSDRHANSSRTRKAREKLLKLSTEQFAELSTDVFDELSRRQDSDSSKPAFLENLDKFHPKRNLARKKLASLPPPRFKDLVTDMLYEIERRDFHRKDEDDHQKTLGVQTGTVIPTKSTLAWSSDESEGEQELKRTPRPASKLQTSSQDMGYMAYDLSNPYESTPAKPHHKPTLARGLSDVLSPLRAPLPAKSISSRDRKIELLLEEGDRMDKTITLHETTIEKLRNDVRRLEQEKAAANKAREESLIKALSLERELAAVNVALEAAKNEKSSESEDTLNKSVALEQEVSQLRFENKNLEREKTSVESLLLQLRENSEKTDKDYQILVEDYKKLQEKHNLALLTVDELRDELKDERKKATTKAKVQEQEIARLNSQIASVKRQLEEAKKAPVVVQRALGDDLSSKESVQEINKIERRLEAVKTQDLGLGEDTESLKLQILDWQKKYQDLREETIRETLKDTYTVKPADLKAATETLGQDSLISSKHVLELNLLITSFLLIMNDDHLSTDLLFESITRITIVAGKIASQGESVDNGEHSALINASVSHAITLTRFYAVHGKRLPKLVVQSAISEVAFSVCNLLGAVSSGSARSSPKALFLRSPPLGRHAASIDEIASFNPEPKQPRNSDAQEKSATRPLRIARRDGETRSPIVTTQRENPFTTNFTLSPTIVGKPSRFDTRNVSLGRSTPQATPQGTPKVGLRLSDFGSPQGGSLERVNGIGLRQEKGSTEMQHEPKPSQRLMDALNVEERSRPAQKIFGSSPGKGEVILRVQKAEVWLTEIPKKDSQDAQSSSQKGSKSTNTKPETTDEVLANTKGMNSQNNSLTQDPASEKVDATMSSKNRTEFPDHGFPDENDESDLKFGYQDKSPGRETSYQEDDLNQSSINGIESPTLRYSNRREVSTLKAEDPKRSSYTNDSSDYEYHGDEYTPETGNRSELQNQKFVSQNENLALSNKLGDAFESSSPHRSNDHQNDSLYASETFQQEVSLDDLNAVEAQQFSESIGTDNKHREGKIKTETLFSNKHSAVQTTPNSTKVRKNSLVSFNSPEPAISMESSPKRVTNPEERLPSRSPSRNVNSSPERSRKLDLKKIESLLRTSSQSGQTSKKPSLSENVLRKDPQNLESGFRGTPEKAEPIRDPVFRNASHSTPKKSSISSLKAKLMSDMEKAESSKPSSSVPRSITPSGGILSRMKQLESLLNGGLPYSLPYSSPNPVKGHLPENSQKFEGNLLNKSRTFSGVSDDSPMTTPVEMESRELNEFDSIGDVDDLNYSAPKAKKMALNEVFDSKKENVEESERKHEEMVEDHEKEETRKLSEEKEYEKESEKTLEAPVSTGRVSPNRSVNKVNLFQKPNAEFKNDTTDLMPSPLQESHKQERNQEFNVDKFDIADPDNTLAELLLYLEHQTVEVILTIQTLLLAIKTPDLTTGILKKGAKAIGEVVGQMFDATSVSMAQSRNVQLREHGRWVVQSLADCGRRMDMLCGSDKSNDDDFADKHFKQRLAGIAFDIAKCTKELVKTVEEASLKEEIAVIEAGLKSG